MSVQIEYQLNNLCLVKVSGILKRAEFDSTQGSLGHKIEAGAKPRLLILMENFEGWERGADWNDLDFIFAQGHEVGKDAIVGEPHWEAQALGFTGAGFRKTPVQFFSKAQEASARSWVADSA